MAQTKVMAELENILKANKQKYYIDGMLNKARVIEDLTNYDPELITLLGKSEAVKKHFLIEINGNKILKTNDLIEIFEMNEYWNDSYTSYENKIGISSNGKFLSDNTDVVLDFPYKDTVLKATMSKEEVEKGDLLPEEPFLNEEIAREEIDTLFDNKVLVNAVKYDGDGSHRVNRISKEDNLIMKGNNLLALHSLKDRYLGKIKLIYIDPPYNTGNDSFEYNDAFNESTWLTFMKNRLEIARDFLSEDGVIFISVDRNQFASLKLLLDEIFNKTYLGTIINVSTPNGRDYGSFAQTHDYIHVYGKNYDTVRTFGLENNSDKFKLSDKISSFYLHPLFNSNSAFHKGNRPNLYYPFYLSEDVDENGYHTVSVEKNAEHTIEVYPPLSQTDGTQFVWRWGKEKAVRLGETELVGQQKNDGSFRIAQKMRPKKQIPRTVWKNPSFSNRRGTEELQELFNKKVFSYPKPEELLKQIIEIGTKENDIVLDFFMGSATTQAVAHKMNRRYIGIEQMNYINTVSVPRLQKVIEGEQGGISKDVDWQGGGSFVYAELMEKNTGYLKDVIEAESTDRLREIFNIMLENTDFDFQVDLEEVKDSVWRLPLEDQKRILVKIIDKNQLYYNYSEIDDENVRDLISDSDYAFNKSFYENEGDENE